MSKTACVIPWTNFVVGPDGRATFCCEAPDLLTVNGRPGSVYHDGLEALWNAEGIVGVRAAMARGERPEACSACWEREASGGVSRRLLTNALYRSLDGALAIEDLARTGADAGFALERRPDWFVLELGNACTLKCRSCSPLFSSRIAGDAIHEAWSMGRDALPAARPRLPLAPEGRAPWFDDVEGMADMVAAGAGENAVLSLLGGEPFVGDRAWRVLEALVARGVAPRIYVGLATNGQHRSEKLAALAPRFRGFVMSVSVDGHGRLYEYLRHGARWRTLVDNLRWFRDEAGVKSVVLPTLQNGNALAMVPLMRFLDEEGLTVSYNVANWPARLRPTNAPPSVRSVAARRLRHYLDAECRPENVPVVRGWCEALEADEPFDEELFREFMTFTNDLDASRGESLRDAAPELVALVEAAGVRWSGVRRFTPAAPEPFGAPRRPVNRTVSPRDVIFPGFEAVSPDAYFTSAPRQLGEIDALLRAHGHPGLSEAQAVADFACHYGRTTRALIAALPHAAVYACDIDVEAVRFCAEELGALPVEIGWRPDEEPLPEELDAVVCVSLLTHTPLVHWRRALRAWARMLKPGGVAAFTYLSERHVAPWLAGAMGHYGTYPDEARAGVLRAVGADGFGFAPLTDGYGGEPLYGVAFGTAEVVRREIEAAGLEVLALPQETSPDFAQDLAIARKPEETVRPEARAPREEPRRDVMLVALYDPRCYAPAEPAEGDPAASTWALLAAAEPPRPLPTELGFGDPRVPEVREAQAALAREHGVDAFCFLYPWGPDGPRWDAPWRDLVASGRPEFPVCLLLELETEAPLHVEAAERLFDAIAEGLADPRYVRVDGRPLLLVRHAARLHSPPSAAAAWRAAAEARGLGALHLAAEEPVPADSPEEMGFDSFVEGLSGFGDAAALARPWPTYRFSRTVACLRTGAADLGRYELELQAVLEASRRRGERVVLLASWNDWTRGRYLEPDDRDGRAALSATRRAARGPASGRVLLRRLRDGLGPVAGERAALLDELGDVLALHERGRDRLLATVEAALSRNPVANPESVRWIPVASRHLPPSGGGFSLDRVGGVSGAELHREPVSLAGDTTSIAGWAHGDGSPLHEVALYLALESTGGGEDRVVRVRQRAVRLDVAAAFPGQPEECGFDVTLDLVEVPPGTYDVALVQRTPRGAYRDVTSVRVTRPR